MIAPFNFRGYTADDPLDRAPSRWARDLVMVLVTAVVTYFFLRLVYFDLHIATLRWPWLFWVEVGFFSVFSLAVVRLRKCSSLLPVLAFVLIALPLDLALEDHVRMIRLSRTRRKAQDTAELKVHMPCREFIQRGLGLTVQFEKCGEQTQVRRHAAFCVTE